MAGTMLPFLPFHPSARRALIRFTSLLVGKKGVALSMQRKGKKVIFSRFFFSLARGSCVTFLRNRNVLSSPEDPAKYEHRNEVDSALNLTFMSNRVESL